MRELNGSEICSLLKEAKTIAVVGISANQARVSRSIAEFLSKYYRVVGVNPAAPSIEGIPVYKSLSDIPFEVDIVDVFRKPETIPELIPEIIKIKPKCLWLQEGIRNDEAVSEAFDSGINIVQDKCIYVYFNRCH